MSQIKDLDIKTSDLLEFLEDVWKTYSVDFREYGKAHLKRRIRHRMTMGQYNSFAELRSDVIKSHDAFIGLFKDFSINVTELFRDPDFYQQLYQILSAEGKEKGIDIWVTACASGEEVYSVLMMLEYFGIKYNRILASDFNPEIVEYAAQGKIESSKIKDYQRNLDKTGFEFNLEHFFKNEGDYYKLDEKYLSRIEFVAHNLLSENDKDKFDLVLCRNVLIYFEKNMQNRVINNLTQSLKCQGVFCLGSKESLRFMDAYSYYLTIDQVHKIYQKKNCFDS